jgi:transposase InsO family protein
VTRFSNVNYFSDLADAREKIETWRVLYNCERPHQNLDYLNPAEFVTRWENNCSAAATRSARPRSRNQ